MIYHVVKTQPSGIKHAIGKLHRTKYTAERYNAECRARDLNTEVLRGKNMREICEQLKAHNATNRQAEQYANDVQNEPAARVLTPAQIHAAIARRDPSVTYERGQFDIEGAPIVCTYCAADPFTPIACRTC